MASVTDKLLKTRVKTPTLGKWSSGFSAVKKYSDTNKVPLIAVWSNGDACGHCINFEKTVLASTFTKWMASSKCVFWFGCSSDKSADDKFEGTGFKFARNGKLTTYPFVRVYWKAGKVDTYKSGDDWTGGSDKGYNTFIKKLNSLLKNYKPAEEKPAEEKPAEQPAEEKPETPAADCEGGDCNTTSDCEGDGCNLNDCTSDCKAKLEALKEAFAALETSVGSVNAQFEAIKAQLAELETELK